MALRKVRGDDDELLRKSSREVKAISASTLALLDDLAETMYAYEGVGLAAPQVGVLRQVAVVDIREENGGKGLIELINPEILKQRGQQEHTEACLSVPGRSGRVMRPTYVKVRALNRAGETVVIEGKDLLAVAICHEIDHLHGVLYTDLAISMMRDEENEDTES